jgi:putative transposase
VREAVAAGPARPLEAVDPLMFFDALRLGVRDKGLVGNKAVPIARGGRADGPKEILKEILGLWREHNEGAKFWRRVLNEIKKPRR